MNQVKRITDKAESLVDRAESVGEFFQATAGKFAVGRLISQIAGAVFDNQDKSRKRRD